MEARLEKSCAVLKGPPDAVHMSSKLVDPEPIQNTQKKLPAAASTQYEAWLDVSKPGTTTSVE